MRGHYQWTELPELRAFKDAAWELRHKRAFVHGEEVKWDTMAQVTWCFHERITRQKEQHCFFDENFVNPWGCRYALSNLDAEPGGTRHRVCSSSPGRCLGARRLGWRETRVFRRALWAGI